MSDLTRTEFEIIVHFGLSHRVETIVSHAATYQSCSLALSRQRAALEEAERLAEDVEAAKGLLAPSLGLSQKVQTQAVQAQREADRLSRDLRRRAEDFIDSAGPVADVLMAVMEEHAFGATRQQLRAALEAAVRT